jgi:acyl-CoA synthetase (AMP-forming)/AMP-acid ligase II/acyl carrier protein
MADDRTRTEARSIPELLRLRAHESPGASAILAPGRGPLSYAGLAALVDSTCAALRGRGIGRGHRVAVVLPNGPEAAIAFLAVSSCATCAPLNPGYRAPEFEFYLSDLRADTLIVPAGSGSPAADVARRRGIAALELQPQEERPGGTFLLSGVGSAEARAAEPVSAEDMALVLHTSGTTARPKIVPLSHRNLCVSAGNVARSLGLGPGDRCLNVMPLFHIHGLVAAVLASLWAGGSVVCTGGFDAEQCPGRLAELQPTWFTAVPTMHQALLATLAGRGVTGAHRSLRFIRSCSSALPPSVMADLERVFGVPVVEAYGMTEAAHQIAVNPLPPGRRKPGSVGKPAGVDVAIMDEEGELLPSEATGEIVVRGANVIEGYEDNPEANAASFTNGWFRTGDEGRLDGDGYLFITGRIKEIINRGGEKVSPREIDEVLLTHPAVAQAIAFAVPHPELGEDIAAAVVLKAGADVSEDAIRAFTADRLAGHKMPRQVLIVPELPKGPTGKLQRLGMHGQLAHLLKPEYAAPRTATEELLAGIWSDVLGVERIGVHDNFFFLGGTSLDAVRLLARLRAALGVDLTAESVFRRPTVGGFAALLDEQAARAAEDPAAARLLAELEAMSEEEAAEFLAQTRSAGDDDEQ